MIKRYVKRGMGLLLSFIFLMTISYMPVVAGENSLVEKNFVYTENGINYKVKYYNLYHYEITNEMSGKKVVINYNDETKTLLYEEYLGNDLLINKEQKVSFQSEEGSIAITPYFAGSYSSANKVTCKWATKNGNHHWYNFFSKCL